MINALLSGLGLGIVLSFGFGTIFFYLIQNSIDNGYKSGFAIASGVVSSDIILIYFAVVSTSFLNAANSMKVGISLVGGGLLIILGIVSFFRKHKSIKYPKTKLGGMLIYYLNGFFLNALNPVNFFTWVAISQSLRHDTYTYNSYETGAFFITCLAAIFLTEVLIAIFAARLKVYFTPKIISYINKGTGLLFLIFGIRLIWQAF